jgi:hypothetical protein
VTEPTCPRLGTAGSAGALTLVGRVAEGRTAEMIRLGVEYDPMSPSRFGSPERFCKARLISLV